jgi:hypothetical protein
MAIWVCSLTCSGLSRSPRSSETIARHRSKRLTSTVRSIRCATGLGIARKKFRLFLRAGSSRDSFPWWFLRFLPFTPRLSRKTVWLGPLANSRSESGRPCRVGWSSLRLRSSDHTARTSLLRSARSAPESAGPRSICFERFSSLFPDPIVRKIEITAFALRQQKAKPEIVLLEQ